MEFKDLIQRVQAQFDKMSKSTLYRTVDKNDMLWDIYLKSFKVKKLWRTENEHNSKSDASFFRNWANIVSLDDAGNIVTMFDIEGDLGEYTESFAAVREVIKLLPIDSAFITSTKYLSELKGGIRFDNNVNYVLGNLPNTHMYTNSLTDDKGVQLTSDLSYGKLVNHVYEFFHFNVRLDPKYVYEGNDSLETVLSKINNKRASFTKTMNLSKESLQTVKEFILMNALIESDDHVYKIDQILEFKKGNANSDNIFLKTGYDNLTTDYEKNNFLWSVFDTIKYVNFGGSLIGTLCTDVGKILVKIEELSNEIITNDAQERANTNNIDIQNNALEGLCEAYNKRADSKNYGKAVKPRTKYQLELANKIIVEGGWMDSLPRRHATLKDVSAAETLYSNNTNGGVLKEINVFANAGMVGVKPKNKENLFEGVSEISIDKFMSDILPDAISLEVYLENKHCRNMMSMFTAKNPDSKAMFSWNNPFSVTNIEGIATKSLIKESLREKGVSVDGFMRCSISWNDERPTSLFNTKGVYDADIHCMLPIAGKEIYYSNKYDALTGGRLNHDIQVPDGVAEENILFVKKPMGGDYRFIVKNYTRNRGKIVNNNGFTLELEIDGEIKSYVYKHNHQSDIYAVTVSLREDGYSVKIDDSLTEINDNASKEVWGLDTNKFHKVNLLCKSPNHWGDSSVGSLSYLFLLEGCKADIPLRAYHASQLNSELHKVRKDLDMLADYTMVQPTSEDELSGLGFNATVAEELIVKVEGSFTKTFKIKF